MHEALLAAFGILIVIFFVAFCGYLFFWGDRFAKRLRERHHSAWLEFGRPDYSGLIFPDSSRFIPYLSRRGYRVLGDDELNRLGDIARALLYISVAAMVFLLADGFTMFFLYLPGNL